MCHLSLPVFFQGTSEFTSEAIHIIPKDWHSDVSVSNMNLLTCWILQWKEADELIPDAEVIIEHTVS